MTLPIAGQMNTKITKFKPLMDIDKDRKVVYYCYIDILLTPIGENEVLLLIKSTSSFEDENKPKAFDLYTESTVTIGSFTYNANTVQVVLNYIYQAINQHIIDAKANIDNDNLRPFIIWNYNEDKLVARVEEIIELYFLNLAK